MVGPIILPFTRVPEIEKMLDELEKAEWPAPHLREHVQALDPTYVRQPTPVIKTEPREAPSTPAHASTSKRGRGRGARGSGARGSGARGRGGRGRGRRAATLSRHLSLRPKPDPDAPVTTVPIPLPEPRKIGDKRYPKITPETYVQDSQSDDATMSDDASSSDDSRRHYSPPRTNVNIPPPSSKYYASQAGRSGNLASKLSSLRRRRTRGKLQAPRAAILRPQASSRQNTEDAILEMADSNLDGLYASDAHGTKRKAEPFSDECAQVSKRKRKDKPIAKPARYALRDRRSTAPTVKIEPRSESSPDIEADEPSPTSTIVVRPELLQGLNQTPVAVKTEFSHAPAEIFIRVIKRAKEDPAALALVNKVIAGTATLDQIRHVEGLKACA